MHNCNAIDFDQAVHQLYYFFVFYSAGLFPKAGMRHFEQIPCVLFTCGTLRYQETCPSLIENDM